MAHNIVNIHSVTPQPARIAAVAEALRNGKVVLYPTDTGYALGCDLENKTAINRVRDIRNLPDSKPMTFICHSLMHIAEFAKVSNVAYKTIKRLIPGPYTFILPATKAVPHFAQDKKRSTAGIRVPNNPIAQALLKEMDRPIISISAKGGDENWTHDEIIERLSPLVDIVIESEAYNFLGESTVIDMTNDEFAIVREGAGLEDALNYIELAA